MIYIGMDISKRTIDVQILKGEDNFEHHAVANDAGGWQQLINIIKRKRHKKVHACCEYTGAYYFGAASRLSRQRRQSVYHQAIRAARTYPEQNG